MKMTTINFDQIAELDTFKNNIDFWKQLNSHYLLGFKSRFTIKLYKNDDTYNGHQEFGFYHLKLIKLEETIQKIISIKFEQKVIKMHQILNQNTVKLLKNKEIKATDIKAYELCIEKQLERYSEIAWLELINKLEYQISDLKRNLPKLSPPEIIETIEINVANNKIVEPKSGIGIHAPILMIPEKINSEKAIIYTKFSGTKGIGHSSTDVWQLENQQWKLINSRITHLK